MGASEFFFNPVPKAGARAASPLLGNARALAARGGAVYICGYSSY